MTSSTNRKVGGNKYGNKNPDRFANCVCVIIVVLMISIMVLFAMLLILPNKPPLSNPKFSVSSFTVTFINATSTYQIALNFTVRNPNSDPTKTMAYDNIVASLYYDNNLIGTTTLFPFRQEEERNSVAVVKAKFMVDPKIDVGVVGVFDVSVSVITALSDNSCVIRRKLDVFCEDIRVESGSMVGPIKDCRVEVSY